MQRLQSNAMVTQVVIPHYLGICLSKAFPIRVTTQSYGAEQLATRTGTATPDEHVVVTTRRREAINSDIVPSVVGACLI